jgi:hypothetical protein
MSSLNCKINIDANNRLYLIPIVSTGFTPVNGEAYDFTMKGEVL